MASLIGESVELTVTVNSNAVFNQTFIVGSGTEISGQTIIADVGGFTLSGTINVNVYENEFTVVFSGVSQAADLTFTFTSLADESAGQITGATESSAAGNFGAHQPLVPTFDAGNGGTATGGMHFAGSDKVTVGQSVLLTLVDAVPPGPVIVSNSGAPVAEGGVVAITSGQLDTEDADTPDENLVYTVIPPSHGILFLDANASGNLDVGEQLADGGTFTQADVNAGRILYAHDGSETSLDGFQFTVSDGTTSTFPSGFTFFVSAVNDAPTILNLDGDAVGWSEDDPVPVALDANLDSFVTDPDNTDFNGGSLRVSFNGSGLTEDQLILANTASITLVLGGVLHNGEEIGTVSGGTNGADLVIDFTSNFATVAAASDVLRAIRYNNAGGENPNSGDLLAHVTLSDGESVAASSKVSITVTETDDPAVAKNDAFSTAENVSLTNGNLFADNGSGNDSDPDSGLSVIAVNGSPVTGSEITLISGALLTVNSDGTFAYNPNGKFNTLPGPASGATNLTSKDSFQYSLHDGSTATVTITIAGVDSDGDVLLGDAKVNTLNGGIGADRMEGAGSSDIYFVDTNSDVIVEGAAEGTADHVKASVSYDLREGVFVELMSTTDDKGTGPINLYGNTLKQTITGNAGANIISDGGAGAADIMKGLGGNDTYRVYNSGDAIVEGAAEGTNDTVLTSVSYDLLEGVYIETFGTLDVKSTAAINLYGNSLKQTTTGNAGANIISDGGKGAADTMRGLGGNDTYRVYNSGDVIVEGASEGTNDTVLINVSYDLLEGVYVETFGTLDAKSTTAINLYGNSLKQTITGNAGANIISDGGAGAADIMKGLGGNDTYRVYNSGDKIVESATEGTNDTVLTNVTYDLLEGVYVETFGALDAKATTAINLYGNTLKQTTTGNAGANIISDGGKGAADVLIGLAGNDTYKIYNAGTVVTEGANQGLQDTVQTAVSYTLKAGVEVEVLTTTNAAGTAALNLYGNEFGQTITGNKGDNMLRGYAGIDVINGGDGADKISGGLGNDTLAGNAGADTYYFSYALNGTTNVDTIKGYSSIDLISLSASIFTKAGPVGALATAAFTSNLDGKATDAFDRIIYETDTGRLYYDSDGTGAAARVLFAVVTGNTGPMNAGDFVIA